MVKKHPPTTAKVARKHRPMPAETITIVEAAQRLGIGRNQAYEAAKNSELPTIRMGNRWLVPTARLDRLLAGEKIDA